MAYTSQIDTIFSGISVSSSDVPHNALAVGPSYVVTAEASRIEWTNLTGGATTIQSVYSFFSSLGSTATNALFDPRAVYDPINQRYIVTIDNIGSNGAITNIYVTAPQYNVNTSGWQGTALWVIGDTAGPGGGIYNGGTMTVVANEITSASQGIYRVVAGNNGKTYYASSYSNGSQIVVTLQIYDVASNTFGPISTIGLGNIDQGGSYTAQQLGTSLLLDATDKRVQNLAYAGGFLWGVTEEKPIGSSVPLVHWFKIDVSNPSSPVLVAQGDISGASLGSSVATFNGSIAVDAAGDVLINFTASGPNMYPSDYYSFHAASDSSNAFSAPVQYQASSGFFNSGNGSSVQRWGINSTAIADPNNPSAFWVSNEYVANNWWQTSVAQIEVKSSSSTTVASIVTSGTGITNGNGDLDAGKAMTLTV